MYRRQRKSPGGKTTGEDLSGVCDSQVYFELADLNYGLVKGFNYLLRRVANLVLNNLFYSDRREREGVLRSRVLIV